jgi:hypothetical protein
MVQTNWRAAHGNAAKHGATVVLETGRDRGLPPASPPETVQSWRLKIWAFQRAAR